MHCFSRDTSHSVASALRHWGIRACSGAVVVLIANFVAASTIIARISVEQALQRGALLWDVRAPADYQKGHVPGAVSIGDAPAVLRDANREDFISSPRLSESSEARESTHRGRSWCMAIAAHGTHILASTRCNISAALACRCITTGLKTGLRRGSR